MNIRFKILLTIGTCIVIIVLVEVLILRALIVNYIEKEELSLIHQDYGRAATVIQREMNTIDSNATDWSQWDDSYRFIEGKYPEYTEIDLVDSSLEALDLNFMFFYDRKGNLFYPRANDLDASQEEIFKKEILRLVKTKISEQGFWSDISPVSGLLVISGKPVVISMSPVSNTDSTAPPNGILVTGRYLGEGFIHYAGEVLQADMSIEPTDKKGLQGTLARDFKMEKLKTDVTWIRKETEKIISYRYIKDFYGKDSMFLALELPRQIYRNGMQAVEYASLFFITLIFIITIICIIVIEKLVTAPLKTLHRFMRAVGVNKDTTARVHLPGRDELAELAEITNNMLGELDSATSVIKIREERFRLIMEATNDGYFDLDLNHKQIYISPLWMKRMGYEAEDISIDFENYLFIIHPSDREAFDQAFDDCMNGKIDDLLFECRVVEKSGNWRWILLRGKLVDRDEEGRPLRFIGTISDITEQKKYEEKNIYLSETDIVTGLKNRAHMDTLLENIEHTDYNCYWIVIGDVNGLKIINENYGHNEGDKLLRLIAEILIKHCSADDITGRWGGDEFIIFIKDKDAAYVDNLISKIKEDCNNFRGYPYKVSIAMGRAEVAKGHLEADAVLKLAEERMCRNKLLENLSARSAIISSLEQTLHEKHIETEEHTRRIMHMCMKIGESMGLTQEELDELALLGVLHDIGKIGIPEAVLLKPGKLTEEEWEVMKTHSEIGSRIAASTPELTHIADDILYHHERYDGMGYPTGLSGTDIPKLARLIAIIDSFDVMTHDRHYKKAMSVTEAFKELDSCAGTQFDPVMVKEVVKLLRENNFSD